MPYDPRINGFAGLFNSSLNPYDPNGPGYDPAVASQPFQPITQEEINDPEEQRRFMALMDPRARNMDAQQYQQVLRQGQTAQSPDMGGANVMATAPHADAAWQTASPAGSTPMMRDQRPYTGPGNIGRPVSSYGSPRSGDWRPGMGAPAPGRVLGGQGGGSPYPQSPRTGDWRPGMTNPAPGRADGGYGGGSPYPQSPRTGDYRPGMGSPAPGRGFGGQGGGSPYAPHSPRQGDWRPGSPSPNPGRPIGGYGRVRRMPQPAAPSGPTQQTL